MKVAGVVASDTEEDLAASVRPLASASSFSLRAAAEEGGENGRSASSSRPPPAGVNAPGSADFDLSEIIENLEVSQLSS